MPQYLSEAGEQYGCEKRARVALTSRLPVVMCSCSARSFSCPFLGRLLFKTPKGWDKSVLTKTVASQMLCERFPSRGLGMWGPARSCGVTWRYEYMKCNVDVWFGRGPNHIRALWPVYSLYGWRFLLGCPHRRHRFLNRSILGEEITFSTPEQEEEKCFHAYIYPKHQYWL